MTTRNLSGQTISNPASEYVGFNFSRPRPDERDGKKVGVQVFPADARITFRRCNLDNVEPPEGAVLEDSVCRLIEVGAVAGAYEIEVGGETITINQHGNVVHGKWDVAAGEWSYYQEPKVFVEDG
jgi:hypothetical protein